MKGIEIMLTTVRTFAVVVSRTSRCASAGKEMPNCERAELGAPACPASGSIAVFWKGQRWSLGE